MGSRLRPKMINLSMDIEDVYGDATVLNDLLKELIVFLIGHEMPCDLYVSGIRLDTLDWLNDFLAGPGAADYIHIGYHSNTHSFKTVPEMSTLGIEGISSVEEKKFDFRSGVFLEEDGGILRFRDLFRQSRCFRCPAFCWTVEYLSYMLSHNMLFSTMDIRRKAPFRFLSLTILPVCEKPLEAYSGFDGVKADIEPYEAVSLYLHPARLIYDNFWDKSKTRQVYHDCRKRIDLLKKILLELKNSFRMISIEDIRNYYRATDRKVPEAEKVLVRVR